MESFDPSKIELTYHEKKEILKEALKEKIARERLKHYKKTLLHKPTPNKMTAEQYLSTIKKSAEARGFEFKIDQHNQRVVKLLTLYFAHDRAFESFSEHYSLDKGILLFGNVGCGKTLLMSLLSMNQRCSYFMIPSYEIGDRYQEDGVQALQEFKDLYNRPVHPKAVQLFAQGRSGICIDDLGDETEKKNFGNELNVIAHILKYRINLPFKATHLTTNLTAKQIKEYYGERVASRMREMFNLISFPTDAPDRRC